MITTVNTCRGEQAVHDTPYWHLALKDDVIFNNNVQVGSGAFCSTSKIAEEPGLQNAHTRYSFYNQNDKKEALFEDVRNHSYPHLPTRIKALYLFDDYRLAEEAKTKWFAGEDRVARECRIFVDTIIHRADASWLNTTPDQWQDAAHSYWKGEESNAPFMELVVKGWLYFPDWREMYH